MWMVASWDPRLEAETSTVRSSCLSVIAHIPCIQKDVRYNFNTCQQANCLSRALLPCPLSPRVTSFLHLQYLPDWSPCFSPCFFLFKYSSQGGPLKMEDRIPSLCWSSLAIAPVSPRGKAKVLPVATKPPCDLDPFLSSCCFPTCLFFSAASVWTHQSCSHLRPCPGCVFRLKDFGWISTWCMPSRAHISNGMSSSQWERSVPLAAVYCPRFWFSLYWFPFSWSAVLITF